MTDQDLYLEKVSSVREGAGCRGLAVVRGGGSGSVVSAHPTWEPTTIITTVLGRTTLNPDFQHAAMCALRAEAKETQTQALRK